MDVSSGRDDASGWLLRPEFLASFDLLLREPHLEVAIAKNIVGIAANLACNSADNRDLLLEQPLFEAVWQCEHPSAQEQLDEAKNWLLTCLQQTFAGRPLPLPVARRLVQRSAEFFLRYSQPKLLEESGMAIEYFLSCEADRHDRVDFVLSLRILSKLKDCLFERNLPFITYKPLLHVLQHLTAGSLQQTQAVVDGAVISVVCGHQKLNRFARSKNYFFQHMGFIVYTNLIRSSSDIRDAVMRDTSLLILAIDALIDGYHKTKLQVLFMLKEYFELEDVRRAEQVLKRYSWVRSADQLIDHVLDLLEDLAQVDLVFLAMQLVYRLLEIGEALRADYDNCNPIRVRMAESAQRVRLLDRVQETPHRQTFDLWSSMFARFLDFD